MKIVCGIDISGSDANIVLLEGNRSTYSIIKSDFNKVNLDDDQDQGQVKSFHETIENFIHQRKIDKISIKRPSNSQFSAGSKAFKIEAILQLTSIPVELIHPTRIASIIKKSNMSIETYEKVYKYQHSAFNVAFCGLEE